MSYFKGNVSTKNHAFNHSQGSTGIKGECTFQKNVFSDKILLPSFNTDIRNIHHRIIIIRNRMFNLFLISYLYLIFN